MNLINLDITEVRTEYMKQTIPMLQNHVTQEEFSKMTWFLDNFLELMKQNNIVLIKIIPEHPKVVPESQPFSNNTKQPLSYNKLQEEAEVINDNDDEPFEPFTLEEAEMQEEYKKQIAEENKGSPGVQPQPTKFNERIKQIKMPIKNDDDEED